ncbi:hypothetical protein QVD17_06571 [Tagetes erecta]|uniref:Uncharacterized protein n=1 Tax=Tagetes erecta TaxID=13708 RepID=A0AAD8LNN1_TARER|nr:hypothetical protein QVD17_06571 [Tagetes erecta]
MSSADLIFGSSSGMSGDDRLNISVDSFNPSFIWNSRVGFAEMQIYPSLIVEVNLSGMSPKLIHPGGKDEDVKSDIITNRVSLKEAHHPLEVAVVAFSGGAKDIVVKWPYCWHDFK